MAHRIDDVDWGAIEHAYGSGEDLPDLLRQLLEGAPPARKKAVAALANRINHQGSPSPAALEVTPFLVEALQATPGPEHPTLLVLVGNLMAGGSHTRVLAGARPPSDGAVGAIRQRAAAAVPRAVALLEDAGAPVRAAAALLLGMASEDVVTVAERLSARAAEEKNATAKASQLLGLGTLARVGADLPAMLHDVEAPELVALAAAAAVAFGAPAELVDEEEQRLVDALAGDGKTPAGFPWAAGDAKNLAAFALLSAALFENEVGALETLLDRVGGTFANVAVAVALIDRLFAGEEARDELRSREELDDHQVAVLRAIAARPVAQGEGVYFALQRHGIVALPKDLQRFVGLTDQGPLDRVVDGEPLWRWLHRLRLGRIDFEAWLAKLSSLSSEEVCAVVDDAGRGGYTLGRRWPWHNERPDVESGDFDAFATILAQTLEQRGEPAALGVLADTLLDKPDYGALVLYAALARALWAHGGESDERVDRLALNALTHPSTMRPLIAALPPERAEKLVLPMGFRHQPRGASLVLSAGWHYADLVGTESIARAVVDAVASWDANAPAPEDRAVEMLTKLGKVAAPVIDERLAGEALARRDVLERARAAIG